MKTISLQISDKEFNSLGLIKEQMQYSEFKAFVEQQIANEAMKVILEDYDCANITRNSNIHSLTLDRISEEMNAARKEMQKVILDASIIVAALIEKQ
jgi:hypothetical protein